MRGGLPYIFQQNKACKFVEQELFGDSDDDQGVTEEEAAFFEEVQRELIAILQDRTKPIGVAWMSTLTGQTSTRRS